VKFAFPLPWFVALVVIAAGAGAATAETLDARADRLTTRFLAGWLERHPEEATRLGDHAYDDDLPSMAETVRADDASWYAAWRDSFESIPLERLDPSRAIDVRLAGARAGREAFLRNRDRLAERDPGFALRILDDAITTPTRGFSSGPCTRGVSLRKRLRAVPEFLRDARLALRTPSRACTEAAIDRAAELLSLCRKTLPELLGLCHESRVQADLAESDSTATAAIAEYGDWLRDDVLPRAVDELPLGRAALEEQLAEVVGAPVSLDSLLVRAREEWSRVADAQPPAIGADRRIGPDSAVGLVDSLRLRAVRSGEFALRESDRMDLGDVSPPGNDDRLVALGPWDARKTRVRVDVGPREEYPDDEPDPMRTIAGARALLVSEGIPGRALFELRSPENRSRIRQTFGTRALSDGWGRYVEWLWAERIAHDESETAVDRAQERDRLARTVAELMLRVEHASIDSVALWLMGAAPLGGGAARRAALRAATEPRWAASTLSFWNLKSIREEAERTASPRFDARSFHDAVIREGAVPTRWVSAGLLAARPLRKRKS